MPVACSTRQRPMGPRIRRHSPPAALPIFPDIITLHVPSFPSARYPVVEEDTFATRPPLVEAPLTPMPIQLSRPFPKPAAKSIPIPIAIPKTISTPVAAPVSIPIPAPVPVPDPAPVLLPFAPSRPAKPVLALGVPQKVQPPVLALGRPILGGGPQPGKPKLKLGLKLDFGAGIGPFAGGYAGGPNNANAAFPSPLQNATNGKPTDDSNEVTMMPGQDQQQLTITATPTRPNRVDTLENLKHTIEEFDEWPGGHEAFEELSRLGEGASGAVYKVRERSTGFIMARKTISTLEAPVKQLLREFKIMSSIEHTNIIHFWGAYVVPSSNEVNILMEFCEGGSLESVGKRLRMIGGRISERVAGRLAEGVSFSHGGQVSSSCLTRFD